MFKRIPAFILPAALTFLVASSAAIAQQGAPKKAEKDGATSAIMRAKSEMPAPIAKMLSKGNGVKFLDKFEAGSGLTGYVLSAATGERRIYYVTPDGKHALYGLMFDENLDNLTAGHQKTYIDVTEFIDQSPKPMDYSLAWSEAIKAKYAFVEGQGNDVYIVFDPACPYCHELYRQTRPYLDRLRLHWLPVGVVTKESPNLVERFVQADDKAKAFEDAVNKRLVPAPRISSQGTAAMVEGRTVMVAAKIESVPLILFKEKGKVHYLLGPQPKEVLDALARPGAASR